jgi:YVTN family beta-propeller protein
MKSSNLLMLLFHFILVSFLFFCQPLFAHSTNNNGHATEDSFLAKLAKNYPPFSIPSAKKSRLSPHVSGKWSGIIDWPHIPVSGANLADGRILTWAASQKTSFPGGADFTYASTWNPSTHYFIANNNTHHDMFAGHFALLEDGRLLVNGGNNIDRITSIFDYKTSTWLKSDNTHRGRWYPTSVALPSGEVFTSLGTGGGRYPEVWTEGTGWRVLTNVSLQDPILQYDGYYEQNWWPLLHLTPQGDIFHSGPTPRMHRIDTDGLGKITPVGEMFNDWYPKHGITVLYDKGKLLVAGGAVSSSNKTSTNQAMIIDINTSLPSITPIEAMKHPRKFHNSVVLPTGEVLVIGGNTTGRKFDDSGTVLTPEIWNPDTKKWREVADSSVPRNYHSIALLLTDGSVLSAGGGLCDCAADHQNGQVYSPSYLFNADGSDAIRPQILQAPDTIKNGQRFTLESDSVIKKFSFIKMSSTTHAINTDLRFLKAEFSRDNNGQYTITAHANKNILTPGFWMLFALNENNVPSIAKIIQVSTQNTLKIEQPKNQIIALNSAVSLVLNLEDQPDNTIRFSATNLPIGLSINDETGLITGVATQKGEYISEISINTLDSHTEIQIGWNIYLEENTTGDSNFAPIISPINHQENKIDNSLSMKVIAIDPNGDWLAYSATGLPNGLSINNTTGVISGTPSTLGEYHASITIKDNKGLSSTIDFDWKIIGKLNITPIEKPPKHVGKNIRFDAETNGGDHLQYNWQFGDGSDETGFSSNPRTYHSFTKAGSYTATLMVKQENGDINYHQFIQAIHNVIPSDGRAKSSMSIVYDSASQVGYIWNVNPDNNSVSGFNTATQKKIAEITVGENPRALAFAPDRTLWVTNKGSSTISIIDTSKKQRIKNVTLPHAAQPYGIVFSEKEKMAYVALEATGQLLKINASTGVIVGSLETGINSRHISINANEDKLYISRFITPAVPDESTLLPKTNLKGIHYGGEIIVVETHNFSISDTVILKHSERADTEQSAQGIPNYLGAVAISPDGLSAWIPSKQDNIKRGQMRNGSALTSDSMMRSISSKINLTTHQEALSKRIDHDNGGIASAATFGNQGNYLFVALEGSREVEVIDAYNNEVLHRFKTGRAPQGLALSPDGLRLYVHNFMDRSVTVYELYPFIHSRSENINNIPLIATLKTVTTESLSSEVLKGKQLFYDSEDPRLAKNQYTSCAACHNEGKGDGRIWDFSSAGEGLRNTISLIGHGGTAQGPLHWTANFDEVHDFEGQIRGDMQGGSGLMSDEDFNSGTHSQSWGDSKAGLSDDLDNLASYVASLNKTPDSPYKKRDGSFTADAQAGKALFISKGCYDCHSGEHFTDSAKDNLHNIGTIKPTSGHRLSSELKGFDTPTLKGLWMTAPYLHDGSAQTLQDAIALMQDDNGVPIETTAQERDLLASYILQLDDKKEKPAPIDPPQVKSKGGGALSLGILLLLLMAFRYPVYRTKNLIIYAFTANI